MKKKLKLLELFGGIGAPRKALENIGYDIKSIDYVEILPQAVVAYNHLFDNDYKPQSVIGWNMNVDMLVHGSPCQDWSTAGLNDIEKGRSILYQQTIEIIEKKLSPRPKYVIWENVKGLLYKNHIKHFNHYLSTMKRLGYKNYYDVLNANDFGIPQARERVFVVSIRDDIENTFSFLNLKTKPMGDLLDYLEEDVPYLPRYTMQQPSMIRALKENKLTFAINSTNTITKKELRAPNAGLIFRDLNKIKQLRKTNRKWKSVGYRLCEVEQELGEIKDFASEVRYLTEREVWRLTGFTDEDFDKIKHLNSVDLYALAGNSIVVQVLEAIFEELLNGEVDKGRKCLN